MNFYQRFLGDYMRDTMHLSLAEHGAYSLLLDTYYATERPLPSEYDDLYRICRAMSRAEQAAVTKVADQFFKIGSDGLRHNKRADEEIAQAQAKIRAAQENGKRGGRPRNPEGADEGTKQEPSGLSEDNPDESKAKPNGKAHHSQNQKLTISVTSPQPVTVVDNAPALSAPAPASESKKSNGVPYERIVEMYHSSLPELPKVAKLTNQRRGYIRQRWLEDLPDLDAWAGYFAIVRKSKFLMGQSKGSNGRPPFRADLTWLCRPENIVKVIEGKYHRG